MTSSKIMSAGSKNLARWRPLSLLAYFFIAGYQYICYQKKIKKNVQE